MSRYRHVKGQSEELSIVAQRIKKLRERNGESQADLAGAINVSKATLANYEQDKANLPLEMAKKIAQHYKVSVDFICGLSENMETSAGVLDTLCHYIKLEVRPFSVCQSHKIPIVSINKDFFNYLNVSAKIRQLEEREVPNEVIEAWREKETEKVKNSLRDEKADNVEYAALLTTRYITSDEVLSLLENAFERSIGDDTSL